MGRLIDTAIRPFIVAREQANSLSVVGVQVAHVRVRYEPFVDVDLHTKKRRACTRQKRKHKVVRVVLTLRSSQTQECALHSTTNTSKNDTR